MFNTLNALSAEQLSGARTLVRVDFNVPMKDGHVSDDSRIVAVLPTLDYLINAGAKVLLISHFGRPNGQVDEALRMDPIAKHLQQLRPELTIVKANDVVGEDAHAKLASLQAGQVLVLENARFEAGEEANDAALSQKLAALCDIYVNDAFGAAHRAHASTEGVAHYAKTVVAGLLMSREIECLGGILSNAKKPVTAIVGGSKVSSKIAVLTNLLDKVDNLIVGGGMAYTFLLAQGYSVGASLCEPDYVETAKEIMKKAEAQGVKFLLSQDLTVADDFNANANTQTVDATAIPDGWEGMDIGPKTREYFCNTIKTSASILWNGPVGVFEWDAFSGGTKALAVAVAEATKQGAQTVLGGGDTVAAIEKFGYPKEAFTHVSTGGGASLEFIEGKALPGIEALKAKAGV
jgi:phosphoglycerate kinase